jgi:predicted transposase YdaD
VEANREHKDSVFTAFFSGKPKLLELYNAIADTNYPPDTDVQINTLKNVLFTGLVNDISFLLGDILVILMEHQSTINPNMPVRFMLYIAQIYERILDAYNLYRRKLIKIPRPEFITLYNGKENIPDRTVLRLSDAFKNASGKISMELQVTIYNINHGRNNQIMNRSRSLADYAAFIAKIREYQTMGQSLEDAIKDAVIFCVEHEIMKDFLEKHRSEVLNMLNVEFKMEDALAVRYEEGLEKGLEEGLEKGWEKGARALAELIEKGYSVNEALELLSKKSRKM